ncbi:hypothetical protein KKH36_01250 [Patescibacteria group bacterium]|nr:hypothetical protein [Patescibacteria group bacterium]
MSKIEDLNLTIQFYEKYIKPIIHTKLGFLILFFIIYFCPLLGLMFFDLYNVEILKSPLYIILVLFFTAVLWLKELRLPKLEEEKTGILFSFSKDIKTNDEIEALEGRVEKNVKREHLEGEIFVGRLKKHQHPKDENKAYSILKKTGYSLLIWGDIESGKNNNEEEIHFVPIRFSYNLNINKEGLESFNKNLGNLLSEQRWTIRDKNNITDRSTLAENIEGLSLYVIGVSLYHSKRDEHALIILKKARVFFISKKKLTINCIIALKSIELMINDIFNEKLFCLNLSPYRDGIDDIKESLEFILGEFKELGFFVNFYLVKGITKFILRDIDGSIEEITNSKNNTNRKDPAPYLNLAFVYYYSKDTANGLDNLLLAIKNNLLEMGKQSITIVKWYEEVLDKEPEKTYLKLPLGILYYDLVGDKSLAEKNLMEYVLEYKNKKNQTREIERSIYEASKRLKKIRRLKNINEN